MADWQFGGDDDMTPAQRLASVISPDIDDSTGPGTPGHPPIAAQPPTPAPSPAPLSTTPATTSATLPNMVPAAFSSILAPVADPRLQTTPANTDAMIRQPSRGEAALANLGPAPQYDTGRLAQLQQQRAGVSTPIDPTQAQYKATGGEKFRRGLGVFLTEGLGGLLKNGPNEVNAPNRRYGLAEAVRQGKLADVNRQITDLDKSNEEQQKNYTGRLGEAREEITQEKNEEADAARQETNRVRAQAEQDINKIRQQAEDERERHNQEMEDVRDRNENRLERKDLTRAVRGMTDQQRDTARESMIDKATQDIQSLHDNYDYDPDQNLYISKKNTGQTLTPQQFTDQKNAISTKLDQQLTGKKMKPLKVRFDVNDAQGSQYRGGGQSKPQQTGNQPQPKQASIQDGAGKTLDAPTAAKYLKKAGGDRGKAQQMAKADNWKW